MVMLLQAFEVVLIPLRGASADDEIINVGNLLAIGLLWSFSAESISKLAFITDFFKHFEVVFRLGDSTGK